MKDVIYLNNSRKITNKEADLSEDEECKESGYSFDRFKSNCLDNAELIRKAQQKGEDLSQVIDTWGFSLVSNPDDYDNLEKCKIDRYDEYDDKRDEELCQSIVCNDRYSYNFNCNQDNKYISIDEHSNITDIIDKDSLNSEIQAIRNLHYNDSLPKKDRITREEMNRRIDTINEKRRPPLIKDDEHPPQNISQINNEDSFELLIQKYKDEKERLIRHSRHFDEIADGDVDKVAISENLKEDALYYDMKIKQLEYCRAKNHHICRKMEIKEEIYPSNWGTHIPNIGSGDCLWIAISNFIYIEENGGKSLSNKPRLLYEMAKILRKRTIQFMYNNIDTELENPVAPGRKWYNYDNLSIQSKGGIHKYLIHMSKESKRREWQGVSRGGSWGGIMEIVALSNLLNRDIKVLNKSGQGYKLDMNLSYITNKGNPIYIFYNSTLKWGKLQAGNHFTIVYPNNPIPPRPKLSEPLTDLDPIIIDVYISEANKISEETDMLLGVSEEDATEDAKSKRHCDNEGCLDTEHLIEDTNNRGTFYCSSCWEEWDRDQKGKKGYLFDEMNEIEQINKIVSPGSKDKKRKIQLNTSIQQKINTLISQIKIKYKDIPAEKIDYILENYMVSIRDFSTNFEKEEVLKYIDSLVRQDYHKELFKDILADNGISNIQECNKRKSKHREHTYTLNELKEIIRRDAPALSSFTTKYTTKKELCKFLFS